MTCNLKQYELADCRGINFRFDLGIGPIINNFDSYWEELKPAFAATFETQESTTQLNTALTFGIENTYQLTRRHALGFRLQYSYLFDTTPKKLHQNWQRPEGGSNWRPYPKLINSDANPSSFLTPIFTQAYLRDTTIEPNPNLFSASLVYDYSLNSQASLSFDCGVIFNSYQTTTERYLVPLINFSTPINVVNNEIGNLVDDAIKASEDYSIVRSDRWLTQASFGIRYTFIPESSALPLYISLNWMGIPEPNHPWAVQLQFGLSYEGNY